MGDHLSDDVLAEVDRAWGEEMLRRSAEVASGELRTVTWDEVLEQVAEQRRSRAENP